MRRPLSALVLVAVTGLSSAAEAAKFFEEVPGAPLGGASEWTNYLRLADLDGDGDLDLIVPNCGGFFSNPQAQPFRVYTNGGNGAFSETPERMGGAFSAAIRVVDVADIDGDGDLDVFAPSAAGAPDRLFLNDGKGMFIDDAPARIASASHSAGARFADVDADGDVDLLVAAGYAASESVVARLYRNDGTGKFVEASGALPTTGPSDVDDVDAFDADRDGDLDFLLASHGGMPALWLNDGNGSFSDGTAKVKIASGGQGYKYGPTPCDVDGDGDLDLWIDNTGPDYTEALLINDGTGTFVEETAARVSGNPGADDNGVVCADVDLDGDYDAIVVSLSNAERVLLNDGTGHFVNVGGFPSVGDSSLWLDVGDLDGDGRLDAVSGQGESGNLVNRVYRGVGDNPVDTRAPVVSAPVLPMVVAKDDRIPLVFRIEDRVLVDSGARVGAFVRVTVDGADVPPVPARFLGGDRYQADLVIGEGASYLVEACATDQHGNTGCAEKMMLEGPGSAATATSSGTGAATGAGGSSASSGGAGGGSGEGSEDSGCSVATTSRSSSENARFVVGLAALALAVGRLARRRVRWT